MVLMVSPLHILEHRAKFPLDRSSTVLLLYQFFYVRANCFCLYAVHNIFRLFRFGFGFIKISYVDGKVSCRMWSFNARVIQSILSEFFVNLAAGFFLTDFIKPTLVHLTFNSSLSIILLYIAFRYRKKAQASRI